MSADNWLVVGKKGKLAHAKVVPKEAIAKQDAKKNVAIDIDERDRRQGWYVEDGRVCLQGPEHNVTLSFKQYEEIRRLYKPRNEELEQKLAVVDEAKTCLALEAKELTEQLEATKQRLCHVRAKLTEQMDLSRDLIAKECGKGHQWSIDIDATTNSRAANNHWILKCRCCGEYMLCSTDRE